MIETKKTKTGEGQEVEISTASQSSTEISRNGKGFYAIVVKCYEEDAVKRRAALLKSLLDAGEVIKLAEVDLGKNVPTERK